MYFIFPIPLLHVFLLATKLSLLKIPSWVAQSVKHPTFDFSSGPDPRVMSPSLMLGSMPK